MAEITITRKATMRRAELALGTAPLPEGVTYLFAPPAFTVGEFPHAATTGGIDCGAGLLIVIKPGNHEYEPWCTRENGHPMPHVAHVGAGQPVAAWTDEQ